MKTLLIIEDEEVLLKNITEFFNFKGYKTYTAIDGIEGVKIAKHKKPDLIICDIMMPKQNGYGVVVEIREDPIIGKTPIIFLSAKNRPEDIKRGIQLGADEYIPKPFTFISLQNSVTNLLKK